MSKSRASESGTHLREAVLCHGRCRPAGVAVVGEPVVREVVVDVVGVEEGHEHVHVEQRHAPHVSRAGR
jgi:hypothetical protein